MVPPNSHITVNTLHVYGQEKTIVLKDINVLNVQDALTPAEIQCDAAALVYDASNAKSFEYIARIYIVSTLSRDLRRFRCGLTININDSN